MIRRVAATLVLAFCAVATAVAAPYRPPPRTGVGVLVQLPFGSGEPSGARTVVLYVEPGIGRVGEFLPRALPELAPAVPPRGDERFLAVIEKRGDWLQVAYDDAGRSGWLQRPRAWRYFSWRDFLKGRQVRLLAGLKAEAYQLFTEPSPAAASRPVPAQGELLRVVALEEEWAMVIVAGNTAGWLRWRDSDGRFRIVVDLGFSPEKD